MTAPLALSSGALLVMDATPTRAGRTQGESGRSISGPSRGWMFNSRHSQKCEMDVTLDCGPTGRASSCHFQPLSTNKSSRQVLNKCRVLTASTRWHSVSAPSASLSPVSTCSSLDFYHPVILAVRDVDRTPVSHRSVGTIELDLQRRTIEARRATHPGTGHPADGPVPR